MFNFSLTILSFKIWVGKEGFPTQALFLYDPSTYKYRLRVNKNKTKIQFDKIIVFSGFIFV